MAEVAGGDRRRAMDEWIVGIAPSVQAYFEAGAGMLPRAPAGGQPVGGVAWPPFRSGTVTAGPETKRRDPPPSEREVAAALAEKDLKKRAQQLIAWGVPVFPDDYEIKTPFDKFFKDLHSAVAKTNEYLGYMNQAADYMRRYGKAVKGVGETAAQMSGIAKKLQSGLSAANGVIDKAGEFKDWLYAMEDFASTSRQMAGAQADPAANRANVELWVKSMKHLWNKTAPFGDWLKKRKSAAFFAAAQESDASVGMAAAETEVIATFAATTLVIGALVYVGIGALDSGLKVVDDYLSRYDDIMARIQQQGSNPQHVEEPSAPGPWLSQDDRRKQQDDDVQRLMRERRADAEWTADQERTRAIQQAMTEFEATVFVKLYQQHRGDIIQKVQAALAEAERNPAELHDEMFKPGNTGFPDDPSPAAHWMGCFSFDTTDSSGMPRRRVPDEDAAQEIDAFNLSRPRCPFVTFLHDDALRAYVEKAVPPLAIP